MIDGGTFLFPICYIFGDILTEVYGFHKARKTIWVGFFCSLLLVFSIKVVGLMPGELGWENQAGQRAYDAILGGVSSGGIIIASLLAYLIGEFTNSITLSKMKIWAQGKNLWQRTIGSTIVGQFSDTFIFILVASLFGIFPWEIFISLMLTNYLFKVSVEVVFTPITYLVVNFLKKAEKEDYYDYKTSLNPFILK